MTESKSVALPLGYTPKIGDRGGIEPPNVGATNRCVNHFATVAIIIFKTGVAGIEPTLTVLRPVVLPFKLYPI